MRSHGVSGTTGIPVPQPCGATVPATMTEGHVAGGGGGGRTLHVPYPTFRCRRTGRSVFVPTAFAEYDPTCAARPPTGAIHSPASASAGTDPVSSVRACSAPIATPPAPAVRPVPLRESTISSGTRSSTSVNGATPYDTFGSERHRVPPPRVLPERVALDGALAIGALLRVGDQQPAAHGPVDGPRRLGARRVRPLRVVRALLPARPQRAGGLREGDVDHRRGPPNSLESRR